MKHIVPILLIALTGILSGGCDDPSRPEKFRVTVNYEIDRKFRWEPSEKHFEGTLLVKNSAISRDLPLSSNSYGVTFHLRPGERTTIIIKCGEEEIYYNGEFTELPMRLPLVMNRLPPGEFGDMVDYDIRAACELQLTFEPVDGRYYLLFSCYDVQAGWLFQTEFEVPENTPISDEKFVPLSAGTQEFDRLR